MEDVGIRIDRYWKRRNPPANLHENTKEKHEFEHLPDRQIKAS
jgi:hypothetical protein